MANRVRVRVELKRLPHYAKDYDREKAFDKMRKDFKRACEKYGIEAEYKERQAFVRKGDKKRRKKLQKLLAIKMSLENKNNNNNNDYDNFKWDN